MPSSKKIRSETDLLLFPLVVQKTPPPTAATNTTAPRPPNRPTLTSSPNTSNPKPATPIKRLSPAELQARHDKGLCYNCDELYYNGHCCRRQFHLLVVEPEPFEPTPDSSLEIIPHTTEPSLPENTTPHERNPAQIRLHALMGHAIPQTLCVLGHLSKQPVSILIDSGSTHNFNQDHIVKLLNLLCKPTENFEVLVGNGEEHHCSQMFH